MGLLPTWEVINGDSVIRFNGNNPKGSRVRTGAKVRQGISRAPKWAQAKASKAAQRRAKEWIYTETYLK